MPKYFAGTKNLPPNVITLNYDMVTEDTLRELLCKNDGRVALSIQLPSFPSDSLGYIFFIEILGDKYSVIDIKDITHFREISISYLSKIVRHASGIEFDARIQAEFHRIRNEIGID